MSSSKSEKKIQPTNPATIAEPAKAEDTETVDRNTNCFKIRKSSRKTNNFKI